MRIDLHNHTFGAKGINLYFKNTKYLENFYVNTIKYHNLDGIAITNYHNIDIALSLKNKFPRFIIAGCEYKVLWKDGINVYIVVLDVNSKELHNKLMDLRLRGIPYFTSFLKDNELIYYMAHLGMGLSLNKDISFLEDIIKYFYALEILDGSSYSYNKLGVSLVSYYNLSPIAGTGYSIGKRRAFTECEEAKNWTDFCRAIKEKKVKVGFTREILFQKKGLSSFLEMSKDIYKEEMQNIWHSEFEIERLDLIEIIKILGQIIFVPMLRWIPHFSYFHKVKESNEKLNLFRERFKNYLKLKETDKIFNLPLSLEEKKEMWKKIIKNINNNF